MDTGVIRGIDIALLSIGSLIIVLGLTIVGLGITFLYRWWKLNHRPKAKVRKPPLLKRARDWVATQRDRMHPRPIQTRLRPRPRAVPTAAHREGRNPTIRPTGTRQTTRTGHRLNTRPRQQTTPNKSVRGAFPIDRGWGRYITPVAHSELNDHQTCPVCSQKLKQTYRDPKWKGVVRCTVNNCSRHGLSMHQVCAQSRWGCSERPAA